MAVHDDVDMLVAAMYAEREKRWNYAQRRTRRLLQSLTAQILLGKDKERLTVGKGRIKEAASALGKIRRKLGPNDLPPTSFDEVDALVNDVVGVRVLAKTPRDLDEISELLPAFLLTQTDITFFPEESNDYVANPKKSGYRARHYVIGVLDPDGEQKPTKVEIQIRTRLQDAWSELTHEDLYKPGPLKPDDFHDKIARTMAGLLNEVDALADHLAIELDSGTDPNERVLIAAENAQPARTLATAVVIRSGPNYALAQANGEQGLVPASVIRLLVGAEKLIDVDDYLQAEDVITVEIIESEKGVYYHPVDAGQLRRPRSVAARAGSPGSDSD
ncbi:RelA/SpoT protein [Nakamurella antarctica]|uniref:RelA/SpoT protein n=1 Tax=Nakamurella antarctica TaxID=1902245 RepID=A0A3G8ZWE8_9ACTN|nr:RelA/SpoT domain-containing protein [Nakamurella antarctica]AZI58326.1 RelA/SpoT protein [Nakamurella antarctica]